jgi:GntR family transcriptional regulator/MocR family aminotransferase
VVVEDPGHVAEVALLRSHNLVPLSVRCDREGLDMRRPTPAVAGAKMLIVTPVGQFPFGSNLGDDRRRAIAGWAKANNAWVLEDDANSEYRWAGKPSPPLAAEFGCEQVIYTSSFNRALGPGFRLAYVVVPHRLLESFTAAQQMSGFHVSIPLQHVLTEFMQRGHFATHLRRHRLVYRERAEALAESLKAEFGGRMNIPEIEAGLQMTVIMNEPCDDVAVSNAALRHNLNVDPLSPCCLLEPKLFGFQIGFGNTPISRIRRGIANLKRTLDAMRPGLRT